MIYDTDVVVIGGGPGGYTAAIHAADLGQDVVLVESRSSLGGVCLTEGCIPSKTLIHIVNTVNNVKEASAMGVIHDTIGFDINAVQTYIQSVVKDLSSGVEKLVANREIERINGYARFIKQKQIYVEGANTIVRFNHAIIATGSRINRLPTASEQPVWTSAEALTIPEIPDSLLVIGGGYIGLEIGQAYAGLGSRISMVEFSPQLLTGADNDLTQVVVQNCRQQFEKIYTNSQVTGIRPENGGFQVDIDTDGKIVTKTFTRVLAATGRRPNTDDLGLAVLNIQPDKSGIIDTDDQCRTCVPHIFAIGDVAPGPALAHKAGRQGKVAAEVIAGKKSAFDNVSVPAVLFTHPEIAWTGLTETDAATENIPVTIGKFPLTALGRAKSSGKTQGVVKVIADAQTQRVLGMGIVGEHASELIAEGNLAIEMGACLEDLIVSIHPHPTFSESIMEAAEMAGSGSVHLFKKSR